MIKNFSRRSLHAFVLFVVAFSPAFSAKAASCKAKVLIAHPEPAPRREQRQAPVAVAAIR